MSIRISTHKYIADIVFLDGKQRTIDYDGCGVTGAGMLLFHSDDNSPYLMVNPASVQTIDITASAQPAGLAQ